jgi:hypothetical protein
MGHNSTLLGVWIVVLILHALALMSFAAWDVSQNKVAHYGIWQGVDDRQTLDEYEGNLSFVSCLNTDAACMDWPKMQEQIDAKLHNLAVYKYQVDVVFNLGVVPFLVDAAAFFAAAALYFKKHGGGKA